MTELEQIDKALKSELLNYLNSKPKGMFIHTTKEKDFVVKRIELGLSDGNYKASLVTNTYKVTKSNAKGYFDYTQFQSGDKKNIPFSFDIIAELDREMNVIEKEVKCNIE